MEGYNPNWVAFAHALGHQPGDLNPGAGTNAMFMGWITRQAGDFTAATGITKQTHPGEYHDLFSAWLTNTWPAPTDATLARALHPAGSGR